MRNLKIYKSTLALLTATSILLLCGCSTSKNDKAKENKENSSTYLTVYNDKTKENEENSCTHLTVYFEDQPITFKECEGYGIDTYKRDGALLYDVKKDGHKLISNGITNQYNLYEAYHNVTDELINNESVQKSR